MISIDDHPPSDPSSSHHHHHQQQHQQKQQQQNPHDPKVSDIDLKSADADLGDTNNPLPNFSIRDYVFSLRSKDIACNWPFSPKSLQLCLKHGVKNVLPPFQSLDSLRNNSSLTRCSLENHLINEELISSFDEKSTNDQVKPNGELVVTKSIGLKGDKESRFHLQPESSQPKSKVKPPSSCQKTENASVHTIIKKSRLVMKVNSGVEQFVSNSESMASKVCPVCKIFSSSSNTTLNAHIDQCLTGEGTMKWTDNSKVVVKHKVKPRKVRLMVDIYKTAPRCTVEELDRRNGTSWATNSNFPALESQFQGEEAEEEKEEPRTTTINPVVADNEGDVYVDTNGTKVRILSVPKAGSSDNLGGRKLLKGVKGSKMIMGKKKHSLHTKKHHKKYLKLSPNARKLCSPKPLAKSGEGEDVGMAENCSKDVQQGRETMKVVDLGIIRPPWACSKRTGLSKKFSSKNQKVELQCHEKKILVVENDKSFSGCDLGTPRSSFNIAGPSQSRKKMKTSLSLIKQPLNRMADSRKEGTRMHGHAHAHVHDDDDDDDDYDDDGEDDHDGDDDCEGSLDACPSQHSDDADTIPKGSKFSSLSKNLSFPGAKFNFKRKFSAVEKSRIESVDGPSQDSSKKRSRMEEHMATKKKEATRSMNASKSSNGESSVGIQTVNGDEFESIRNETSLAIPSPSFMGLSTSFDPEFSKQECIEIYQDQICSTNRAPNDVEKQENYFQKVNPIPIPGPPGSFLPASPGGEMVSEQHIQASTVHSSENHHHHDTMDQDSMSNSPVSTISNSRSTSAQEETYKKPFFNGNMGYTETGQSHNSFKNDQPCCCTRKEVALNYPDSYFLMKQPIESNMRTPSSLNFRSETFSVSNYPTSPAPDSAASPSKPVLRLMGKNLTVNKTDEEDASLSSQHFRPPQSSQQHPHRPVIFNQYQNGFDSRHLKAHPHVHMISHVDSRPVHGGFMAPGDRYGHDDSYLGLGPTMHQDRSHHGHNILNSQALSGRNVYNAVSSSRPVNETIILDDSPENEADHDPMQNDFYKGNQAHMNPLYTMYPSYSGGPGGGDGGSSVFSGGSFQTSLANGNLGGKWNVGPSTAYYPQSYP